MSTKWAMAGRWLDDEVARARLKAAMPTGLIAVLAEFADNLSQSGEDRIPGVISLYLPGWTVELHPHRPERCGIEVTVTTSSCLAWPPGSPVSRHEHTFVCGLPSGHSGDHEP